MCYLSERTTSGQYRFRYSRMVLRFPASVEAPDGSTRLYLVRLQWPGEEPVAAANCRIPNTDAAVSVLGSMLTFGGRTVAALAARRAASPQGAGAPDSPGDSSRRKETPPAAAMAPASSDDRRRPRGAVLVPRVSASHIPNLGTVYVYGQPDCWACYGGGGGWYGNDGSSSKWDDGGGSYYDPGVPEEIVYDGARLEEVCPSCQLNLPSPGLVDSIKTEGARLRDKWPQGDLCNRIGQAMIDNVGTIRTTPFTWRPDPSTLVAGDSHDFEPVPGSGTVHVALAWDRPPYPMLGTDFVLTTVVHEFAHLVGKIPRTDPFGVDQATATARTCQTG